MPVHPEIQSMLDAARGAPAMQTLPIEVVRVAFEKQRAFGNRRVPLADISERNIEGPGGALTLRIYTPHGDAKFPMIVFYHGSGFVLCSLDTHDMMCRLLCDGVGAVVVSVDYRLAPEHRFPAGLEDCLAATRWAVANADALHADPAHIAIAGDSAGGNLAAVAALRLRDENGPAVAAQLLIYPVTDAAAEAPSYAENAEGFGLTQAGMKWFFGHYFRGPEDALHPNASPARSADFSKLPPAFVLTAQYDPLRDEGEQYAAKLIAAGVPTKLTRYDGMNHGFFFWYDRVDTTRAAMKDACDWLKARLAPAP